MVFYMGCTNTFIDGVNNMYADVLPMHDTLDIVGRGGGGWWWVTQI